MTKSEAGKLGGLATLAKHGREHFRKIAPLGGRAFWAKYTLHPVGGNDFLIVNRESCIPTGKTINGRHLPPPKEPKP